MLVTMINHYDSRGIYTKTCNDIVAIVPNGQDNFMVIQKDGTVHDFDFTMHVEVHANCNE